jgi:hypothetical protein
MEEEVLIFSPDSQTDQEKEGSLGVCDLSLLQKGFDPGWVRGIRTEKDIILQEANDLLFARKRKRRLSRPHSSQPLAALAEFPFLLSFPLKLPDNFLDIFRFAGLIISPHLLEEEAVI